MPVLSTKITFTSTTLSSAIWSCTIISDRCNFALPNIIIACCRPEIVVGRRITIRSRRYIGGISKPEYLAITHTVNITDRNVITA